MTTGTFQFIVHVAGDLPTGHQTQTHEEIHAPPSFDGAEGLLAIIIRRDYSGACGVRFFTDPALPQQLAVIRHPPGHDVPAHVHRDLPRTVSRTQEVLVVRKGYARLDLYTSAGEPVCQRWLEPGDVAMLVSGGHALRSAHPVEDLELLEIKQGPYAGRDADKVAIRPEPTWARDREQS